MAQVATRPSDREWPPPHTTLPQLQPTATNRCRHHLKISLAARNFFSNTIRKSEPTLKNNQNNVLHLLEGYVHLSLHGVSRSLSFPRMPPRALPRSSPGKLQPWKAEKMDTILCIALLLPEENHSSLIFL